AVSLERLEEDANGDLIYSFHRPWSDGTTGIKLSPLELLEKLSALVPLPRVHLVRYAGCLAPHSTLRDAIVPAAAPTGCGRRGNEDGNTLLEVDAAAGTGIWPGYGHMSVLPAWLTPDHYRHHPGVGDHAHLASSQASVRSTSHCTCPLSPRDIRFRLSPRP